MKIALLADIHGNVLALEAVLKHLQQSSVDKILCLGDLVLQGPKPQETYELLRSVQPMIVQGSTDLRAVNLEQTGTNEQIPLVFAAIEQWGSKQLSSEQRTFLEFLPRNLQLDLPDGRRLLGCHGAPHSMEHSLSARLPQEVLSETLSGFNQAVIAYGRTHQQEMFNFRGQLLVNPGSIGLPKREDFSTGESWYAPWTEYASLSIKNNGEFEVNFYQVPYDIELLIEQAFLSGLPEAGWWVTFWERGLAKGR